MSERRKVAYEADRLFEALFGDAKAIESFAAANHRSIDFLRETMQPSNREDYLALFEAALRLDVSPFWVMGYDVPKHQTEEEKNFKRMLLLLDEMSGRPNLLEIVLRMAGFSKEEILEAQKGFSNE